MLDAGISTRRGIMCSHREEAYRDFPLPHALPESERAQDECILLPLYPAMAPADQERVGSALRRACLTHEARSDAAAARTARG
jgi:dTDP-4-amino-4,6-dideoxygalactose transaminase